VVASFIVATIGDYDLTNLSRFAAEQSSSLRVREARFTRTGHKAFSPAQHPQNPIFSTLFNVAPERVRLDATDDRINEMAGGKCGDEFVWVRP